MSGAFNDSPPFEFPGLSRNGCRYRAFELVWGDGDRAAMLGLRLKTGGCVALGYAWLSRVDFDPTGTVTLTLPGVAVVELTGRNLGPVYEAVASHRALWVAEADRPIVLAAADCDVVIESIACFEFRAGACEP